MADHKSTLSVRPDDMGKWLLIAIVVGLVGWLAWRFVLQNIAKAKTSLDILDVKLNSDNITPQFAENVDKLAAEAHDAFVNLGFWNTIFDKEDAFIKRKSIAERLLATSDDELKLFSNVYNSSYPEQTFYTVLSENKGGLADASSGKIDKLIARLEFLKLK